MPENVKSKAMWGGRFEGGPDDQMRAFSESVSFDKRLYAQDIRGSIAHARMLAKIGVLKSGEFMAIERGLVEIRNQIDKGTFVWKQDLEDVHMNIEAALTQKVPAGAKLHTGRSRNDQVATDMRLWIKDEIDRNLQAVLELQRALVALGESCHDVVLPGYTHLQRAQPILFPHHCLAYVEMLERDAGRFQDVRKRADVLPLGSGALAGSTLPLDREMVAKELDFSSITQNSLDAVSDRDFIVEYGAAAALAMVHLSRLAEDLILWSSAEFRFIRLGDDFTTGSSLMPQKRNPDAAELIRGKSARSVGNLTSLLVLLKGLPMTYNRDLQEDKERLFDTADTLQACLEIMAKMLATATVNRKACEEAASDPLLLATDVADALVRRGIPFRKAHEIVGQAVARVEKWDCGLDKLSLSEWQGIDERIRDADIKVFDVQRGLSARTMTGAPSPKEVSKQLQKWNEKLKTGGASSPVQTPEKRESRPGTSSRPHRSRYRRRPRAKRDEN